MNAKYAKTPPPPRIGKPKKDPESLPGLCTSPQRLKGERLSPFELKVSRSQREMNKVHPFDFAPGAKVMQSKKYHALCDELDGLRQADVPQDVYEAEEKRLLQEIENEKS